MTIHSQGPGAILFLTREELAGRREEELLPFLRARLIQAGHLPSSAPEIRVFPSRQGALFLVLPGLGYGAGNLFSLLS